MEPKLRIQNINKKYGTKSVLEDITFDVQPGEFVSILGSSGCGKTTLLRIIMGIEKPDTGSILKDGKNITDLKPSERGMGIVFQNYALFPNMNVYDNIAFALKCRHLSKDEIKKKVDWAIKAVGLVDHAYKKPAMLSGGQQQRVAIARTIVLDPDIILFDEPMAALDADIRMSLRKELKDLQKNLHITMIYVTHDQEEAFSMSDKVIVMYDSLISQMGTPHEIYCHPANDFVKRFVVGHLDEKVRSIEEHIK
jgi:iron(III) transport system ATP-binding protein